MCKTARNVTVMDQYGQSASVNGDIALNITGA